MDSINPTEGAPSSDNILDYMECSIVSIREKTLISQVSNALPAVISVRKIAISVSNGQERSLERVKDVGGGFD